MTPVAQLSNALGFGAASVLLACADPMTPATEKPPTSPPPAGPVAVFTPGMPVPWRSGTAAASTFEVGLDRGIRRNGGASAYIRTLSAANPGNAFGSFSQSFSAAPYRGRRVRFGGYIRTENVSGTGAGLWMRVDGPTGMLRFDNMISYGRGIVGTRDWTPYSVVLDVPANAISITSGLLVNATGVVRADDFNFEIVDNSIPVTGTDQPGVQSADSATSTNAAARLPNTPVNVDFEGIPPLSGSTASWLASVARPFVSELPGTSFEDLAELGAIVGSARIAAFGEGTHGTAEFFRMKHRAFEYLASTQGFTVFTIEATMPESRAIDHFVMTGEGTASQLLQKLGFWTWNTQEVLDLILWIRAYNTRPGVAKLRFIGFDMQSPELSIDSVRSQLARLDTALAARARRATECLAGARAPATGTYSPDAYRASTNPTQRTACADSLAALSSAVATTKEQWTGRISSENLEWLQQYLTLIRQWERMAAAPTIAAAGLRRDEAMAENLLWASARHPTARLLAWAHNGHVSRRPGTMGHVLGQRLGGDYRTFGLTFGTGEFNAVELTASGARGSLRSQRIVDIDSTSIERVFAATGQPRLIFDTRRLSGGGAAAAPLTGQPVRMRSIGSMYGAAFAANFFEATLLPEDYDGLIWFAFTSPSALRPF